MIRVLEKLNIYNEVKDKYSSFYKGDDLYLHVYGSSQEHKPTINYNYNINELSLGYGFYLFKVDYTSKLFNKQLKHKNEYYKIINKSKIKEFNTLYDVIDIYSLLHIKANNMDELLSYFNITRDDYKKLLNSVKSHYYFHDDENIENGKTELVDLLTILSTILSKKFPKFMVDHNIDGIEIKDISDMYNEKILNETVIYNLKCIESINLNDLEGYIEISENEYSNYIEYINKLNEIIETYNLIDNTYENLKKKNIILLYSSKTNKSYMIDCNKYELKIKNDELGMGSSTYIKKFDNFDSLILILEKALNSPEKYVYGYIGWQKIINHSFTKLLIDKYNLKLTDVPKYKVNYDEYTTPSSLCLYSDKTNKTYRITPISINGYYLAIYDGYQTVDTVTNKDIINEYKNKSKKEILNIINNQINDN